MTKIHFIYFNEKRKLVYLCNQAVRAKSDNITNDYFKLTCKNCKSILNKEKKEEEKGK